MWEEADTIEEKKNPFSLREHEIKHPQHNRDCIDVEPPLVLRVSITLIN